MCDPLTIAVSVAAAAAVTGTGMSAYGQYKQGQFQKDMSKYQAGLERNRAMYAQKQGEVEAAAAEKRHRQLAGAGLTAFAGNGVLLESRPDSAVAMWEVDQAKEAAWDKELIRNNAELSAWGFKANADSLLSQGDQAAAAGTWGAVGTVMGGVGSAGMLAAAAAGAGGSSGGSKYMSGSTPTGGFDSMPDVSGIA